MAEEQPPGGEWGRHGAARPRSAASRARSTGVSFLVLFVLALAGDGTVGWILCGFAGGQDPVACPARWIGGHYLIYVAAAVVMAIIVLAVRRRKD